MRTQFSTIIMVITIFIIGIFCTIFPLFNDHSYTVRVVNKDQIVKSNDNNFESYYLISCKDYKGNYYEFQNKNLGIRKKYDSSAIYNQLEIGCTYKFTVVGFRIEMFSWYENIIDFKKVN